MYIASSESYRRLFNVCWRYILLVKGFMTPSLSLPFPSIHPSLPRVQIEAKPSRWPVFFLHKEQLNKRIRITRKRWRWQSRRRGVVRVKINLEEDCDDEGHYVRKRAPHINDWKQEGARAPAAFCYSETLTEGCHLYLKIRKHRGSQGNGMNY